MRACARDKHAGTPLQWALGRFGVWGWGLRVGDCEFWAWGLEFNNWRFGIRICDLGFEV